MASQQQHAHDAAFTLRGHPKPLQFSIVTFNLLAPCYAVRPPALCERSQNSGCSGGSPEWSQPQRWQQRAERTCTFLADGTCTVQQREDGIREQPKLIGDIICLQEYLFEPAYEEIFQTRFPAETFRWIKAKRPGSKRDGLAVFFRRTDFHVEKWRCFTLTPLGDRIGLLVHLRSTWAPHMHLLVLNVHLTYPHHIWDNALRKHQVRTVHHMTAQAREEIPPCHRVVVLCGDWNTLGAEDPVLRYLESNMYVRCRLPQRSVTHLTHDGKQICCDHVFLDWASEKIFQSAQLLPPELEADQWPDIERYDLSDHRPVRVLLRLETERSAL